MLGLGFVKKAVVKKPTSVLSKSPLVFLRKKITFAQTAKLLFDRHQLLLVNKICKMILSSVKTRWISSLHDSHAFNQADLNVFVANIRYKTVVKWLKPSIGSLGH